MAVCNPAANAPPPAGVRALTNAELASARDERGVSIHEWAMPIANDLSVPYWNPATGAGLFRKWFGALPIVGLVQCHSDTVQGGQTIAGAYHGVTAFVATDPKLYPTALGAVAGDRTDWPTVIVATAAIGVVVAGFFAVLRVSGAERARA